MSAYNDLILSRSGLVAYYKCDETSGATMADAKNGYNATLQGTYTRNVAAQGAAKGVALSMAGAGRAIATGNSALAFNSVAPFTVECWVKTSSSSVMAAVTKYQVGPNTGWGLGIHGGAPRAWCGDGAWLGGTTTVHDGNWHLLDYTLSGTTVKIYIDGVINYTVTGRGPALGGTSDLNIGTNPGGVDSFTGTIDEIALYNVALDAGQIAEHFAGVPATPPYKSWWAVRNEIIGAY